MSLFMLVICSISCQPSKTGQPNGWYHLNSNEKATGTPFLTVKDFAYLRLDSGWMETENIPFYEILGKVRKDKLKQWADETEKAIGKKIGFVYMDKVLCAPSPNLKLEDGYFSISLINYNSSDAHEIYRKLRKELSAGEDLESSLTSEEMLRFDSLYVAWKKNYLTNPVTQLSSSTNSAKELEQYPELLEMGKRAIPMIITRLPVRSDFFALTLYNDLQDVDSLKCYEPGSEQYRVKMTLKKYFEAKTGKKKREFSSDTEKIEALKELINTYGWEEDSTYTREEKDSILLDMDYDLAEELFKMFKDS